MNRELLKTRSDLAAMGRNHSMKITTLHQRKDGNLEGISERVQSTKLLSVTRIR